MKTAKWQSVEWDEWQLVALTAGTLAAAIAFAAVAATLVEWLVG